MSINLRLHVALVLGLVLTQSEFARSQAFQVGSCRLGSGETVASRASMRIPDIALATRDPSSGEPVVYYNPSVMRWLPWQLRTWIFTHECAHLVLDHLRKGPASAQQEIEADCWATADLTAHGVLTPVDIAGMEHAIAILLPEHWRHMPGRFRAINLQACIRTPIAGYLPDQRFCAEVADPYPVMPW